MTIIWKSNNNKRSDNFEKIKTFLKERKKENPNYKILDAGGAVNPWASEYTDAYLDIQDVPGKRVITGDIQSPEVWKKVNEENFDFIICSHTLEDIKNPGFVIEKILENCKEGFISIPNKHTEMSHVESLKYLGYCHHQYMFMMKDDTLFAIRKFVLLHNFIKPINFLPGMESISKLFKKLSGKTLLMNPSSSNLSWVDKSINNHEYELAFLWKDKFDFKYLNDDFLSKADKYLNVIKKEMQDGL
jgi:hypothetical protein